MWVACAIASPQGAITLPDGKLIPPTAIPQPCGISFAGSNLRKQPISQICEYSGTALNPALQLCVFDARTFGDVVTLNVDVESSLTLPNTTSIYLDNIVHENFY